VRGKKETKKEEDKRKGKRGREWERGRRRKGVSKEREMEKEEL